MSIKIKNSGKITSSEEGPISSLSLLKFTSILKGKQEFYSARNISKRYNSQLSSIATKLNNAVRKEIASSFGGSLLSSRSNTGFRPSYTAVIDDRVETGKIRELELKQIGDKFVAKRGLQLAGSSGISISKGRQTFLTGFTTKEGKVEEKTSEVATTRLFNRLLQSKDSDEIKRILSSKGQANTALRENIELNTQTINIISTINGKVENRRIGFTWSDIKNNRDIKVSVKKQSDESISLQVYFTTAILNKVINDSNRVHVKSLEDQVSEVLLTAASEILVNPTERNILEIRKLLLSQSSKYAVGYLSDRNVISKGIFSRDKDKKKTRKKDIQKIISNAQLSAIVRQQTEKKMPRGEVGGPPKHPTILTYRTGRFVKSIRVRQVFSDEGKLPFVEYYYMPLYQVHEFTRPPSGIIKPSIREAVKTVYKNIVFGEPRPNFSL